MSHQITRRQPLPAMKYEILFFPHYSHYGTLQKLLSPAATFLSTNQPVINGVWYIERTMAIAKKIPLQNYSVNLIYIPLLR